MATTKIRRPRVAAATGKATANKERRQTRNIKQARNRMETRVESNSNSSISSIRLRKKAIAKQPR